uniref:RNA polymerase beta'' subunit n=1 Tax=Elaphoglossum yoshinagae TaxID=32140 RepID=UPI0022FD46DB|nr:RNA polymerase beta'' subunit [Elaphoglossum yoshinagae]WAU47599.1 RNA polymerase beta'' subunit [Elaphoglossum yoshinagae]
MNPSFKMIDPLNPVHMMSFSGARGSVSQVHQLLGMRGLMSDPRGQVIDLPIRRNLREGLSLTEYIISCYGARKGVVDTAVRTSDAGYLTRRLVEVVQHIVVRKKDCETTKSIDLLNIIEEKRKPSRTISYQKLVGRVLADNVYQDVRCIATRNQDISDVLASNLVVSTQPIYVRSPLTRKSIFRICQLCYGWNLAQYDLVELGEAVGIIAGQSIGEPGTQLTSRTFHTGGVFTGDIAEYVRIPFNGLINSDGRLVYPTRTRHGHPAWMCQNDLSVVLTRCGDIHKFVVPARSLLMIRSGQYVEARQIIAEVRAKEFPLKERIQKAIYPNLKGEIHWNKFVWQVRDYIGNPIRVVREAGHIRILSGTYSKSNKRHFFYKDQDRVGVKLNSIEKRFDSSKTIGEKEIDADNVEGLQKNIQIFVIDPIQEFGIDPKYFLSLSKLPISNYILSNVKVDQSEKAESVSLLFDKQQANLNKSGFANIDVQLNSILERDDILAIYDKFEYQTAISGIIRYGTVKVEPIDKKIFDFDGKAEKTIFCSWYRRVVGGGNFFLIPEESYIIDEPTSPILVTNNTVIEEGERITDTISSKIRGLIQIEKTLTNSITVRILPGYIHNSKGTTNNILRQKINLIEPLGNSIHNGTESEDWVYLQAVTLYRGGKTFAPVRPVVKYEVSSDSLVQGVLHFDKPKTQKHTKARSLRCISHINGKIIEMISHTTNQLVRTFLVSERRRHFDKNSYMTSNYLSLTTVGISNLLNTFIQVNLVMVPPAIRFGVSQIYQKLVSVDKPLFARVNLSDNGNDLVLKNQSFTIHSVSDRGASFLTLSPFDFYRNNLFADSSNNNYEERVGKYFSHSESDIVNSAGSLKNVSFTFKCGSSSEKCPSLKIKNKLGKFERSILTCCQLKIEEIGLLGTSYTTFYLLYPPRLALNSKASFFENYFLNYSTDTYATDTPENQHRFLIDENTLTLKCVIDPFFNRFLLEKPINSSSKLFSRKIFLISLGLLINRNRFFCRGSLFFQSGQVVAIYRDYLLVRTGKTLLATQGAAPYKISGDIIGEGDTLIKLPYDRLKSGDITQGLPKVEQLLESRSIASISVRIEDLSRRWTRGITRLIGNLWSHFLSAGTSMKYCQLILINEIRGIYESQGVQISDKHLEIIIRQLTSRIVASEDGITNVFFPGELVELAQAERMNRVLNKPILYEPIILGMTKASLNTSSFLSEASFQETTRVLAKAALRGRIDWLKGLKENVILGDSVPVGTGSTEIICQLEVNRQKGFHLEINRNRQNPTWEIKYNLCHYRKKQNIDPNLFLNMGLKRFFLPTNLEVR